VAQAVLATKPSQPPTNIQGVSMPDVLCIAVLCFTAIRHLRHTLGFFSRRAMGARQESKEQSGVSEKMTGKKYTHLKFHFS